jgi:hypothetical protein
VWVRDEGETAVYRIVQRDIRAAKLAATLTRRGASRSLRLHAQIT